MIIRKATVQDSVSIGKVQLESWRTMFPDSGLNAAAYLAEFSFEERAEDWRALLSELPENEIVIVAQDDGGDVIGFADGELQPVGRYGSELNVVHILPASRNQGIGRKLIAAMAHQLEQAGARSIWLWTLEGNVKARRLYEYLGGELVDRQAKETGKNEVGLAIVEVAYAWPDIYRLIAATQK